MYIPLSIKIRHFKQLNRRLWNVLVVASSFTAMLALWTIGSVSVANAEMRLSWADRVYALNAGYLEKNKHLKEVLK